MSTKIGASISLEGEKEFRRAITDINTGLRVNASELALVTARYSDNANSVKALTDKQVVFENRLTGQKDKIERLRTALENSSMLYGAADAKTLKWQESLYKAEAELIKMDGELKNNSEALQKATDDMEKYGLKEDEVAEQTQSLGGKLNEVINSLGIQLPAGAEKAVQALDKQKASTMALIGVTVGLVSGFARATLEAAKMADDLLTLSDTTRLSTDTLQELQYASEFVDVSLETMTGSMTKMIRSMNSAERGTKSTSDAFRDLRVRVTDAHGQLKDSETMFYEIIDALGKVGNETKRDALAMEIFGRSARELNPLIEAGSKRLKELGIEAQNMGYVMDEDALESLGRLDDAMQKFDKQGDAFKNSISLVMLPPLTALFELLNKIDPKILATVAIIGTVAVVAVSVIKAVGSITSTFSAMNPVTLKTTAIVVGVVAALIALAAIIAVIIGKGDELNRTMKGIGNSTNSMINGVNQAPLQIGRNAKGTASWRGGLTWVGEEGPELIDAPVGSSIYSNSQSMQMARNSQTGGYGTLILNVKMSDVDDVQKLINVSKQYKQRMRAGTVMA